MFPMKNRAFLMYGEPCDAFFEAFNLPVEREAHPGQPKTLYVVRAGSFPAIEALHAKSLFLVLMDAAPCRNALRAALNFVRRVDGGAALDESVSDANLAAAMRGVVGMVRGFSEVYVPPFRCITNNRLVPYPPLAENDLELSDGPTLFRGYTAKDDKHKLQLLRERLRADARSLVVASSFATPLGPNVCVVTPDQAVPAEPTFDDLFFLQPPPSLVRFLSAAKPGANVHLFATYSGDGQPETPELYEYRKQENELSKTLKLVLDNSLLFYNPTHTTNPYLLPLMDWRAPPSALQWGKDAFRNNPVIPLRDWRRLVRLVGGGEEILDALLACDDVAGADDVRGTVRCVEKKLYFAGKK